MYTKTVREEHELLVHEKKASLIAAWISVFSNIFLTVIKIVVGVLFNSQVLIADGVHNAGDVIASIASLTSMRIANQPPDEDHPYGHGKAEVVAALIVGFIMALAAMFIAYHSVENLFQPVSEPHVISLIAASISLVWKQSLYLYTIRIGKQINSKGLIATAYDHLADVYASIAAFIGIGLSFAGQAFELPYLELGDPISGIIVAGLVMKLAYEMANESIQVLMEKNIESEKLDQYTELVKSIPYVKRIDRLRARDHGHYVLVDVRVSIPWHFTIKKGHDLSREIKQKLMKNHKEIEEVLIHLNPWCDHHKDDPYTENNCDFKSMKIQS